MTTDAHGPEAPRKRNAKATKAAIFDSAVAAFTRHGYDGVGVRDIAEAAGVTAMLVNRYFGSKEGLFEQVVDSVFAPRTVVADDPVMLGTMTAATLAARTAPGTDQLDPFLLMLRSIANPRAAEIIRVATERNVGAHLADRLSGSRRNERAELALSVIAGVWLMRTVVGTTALREAKSAHLERRLDAMLSAALSEDID